MIEKLLTWALLKWQNRESLKLFGVARSSEWWKTKLKFEKLHPKVCAVCNGTKSVQLHHKLPFHNHPELENDLNNLIWLCEEKNCHLRFGHLYSFRSWNETIEDDAKYWRQKISTRP